MTASETEFSFAFLSTHGNACSVHCTVVQELAPAVLHVQDTKSGEVS